MRSVRQCLLMFIVVVFAAIPSIAIERARYQELNQKAREFAKQKDWQGMRSVLIQLGKEMPDVTPVHMLRMASVEARLGNSSEAVAWMRRYAATGLTYDVTKDDELKVLADEKAFKEIAAEMQNRSKVVTNAEVVCTIPLPDMMPEDVTFDRKADTFIMSSVQHHTLHRVSLPKSGGKECKVREIPLEPDAKRWPVMAVSYDAKRDVVWMSASAMPGFSGFPETDSGKAALLAVNGTTGKTVRRFDLESKAPAVLGDMCLAADGTIYITDSIGGGVYRVRGEIATAKLEQIAEGLLSPQTPVLATDGKRLFIAEYPVGIAVLTLGARADEKWKYLPHPENVAVTGLDGLYRAGNSLIGIENGTQPERMMRYRLNDSQTEITAGEVVEQDANVGDPSHAVEVDGWFYALSNVGWDKVDDSGKLKAGEQFTAPMLLRFRK